MFFGGLTYSYPIPAEYGGVGIFPGHTFGFNLGTTFAVTDSTTLGLTVNGAYKSAMQTDGVEVPNTTTAPVSTTFSVFQRLANDFYVEPSITMGLTSDAANSLLSVKVRKTY